MPDAHESSLAEEGRRLTVFTLYNVVRSGSWHDSTTFGPCPGTWQNRARDTRRGMRGQSVASVDLRTSWTVVHVLWTSVHDA